MLISDPPEQTNTLLDVVDETSLQVAKTILGGDCRLLAAASAADGDDKAGGSSSVSIRPPGATAVKIKHPVRLLMKKDGQAIGSLQHDTQQD